MRFKPKAPMSVVFCDPNIASVGALWGELDHEHCAVGEVRFGPVGRAVIMGRNRGILRMYADKRSRHILGAAMVGTHCEHLAHLAAWAMEGGMTVGDALRMPYYHPVLEDEIQDALYYLDHQLNKAGSTVAQLAGLDAEMTSLPALHAPNTVADESLVAVENLGEQLAKEAEMSCFIPSACAFCLHYHQERNEQAGGLPSCDAFPVIPDDIFGGRFDHNEEFPGDSGIRFSLVEAERQAFSALNEVRREHGLMAYRER